MISNCIHTCIQLCIIIFSKGTESDFKLFLCDTYVNKSPHNIYLSLCYSICQNRHLLKFFLPSTIKLWNSLPDPLTDLEDISQFKNELSLHLFPKLIYMYNYLCLYTLFECYAVYKYNNNNMSCGIVQKHTNGYHQIHGMYKLFCCTITVKLLLHMSPIEV